MKKKVREEEGGAVDAHCKKKSPKMKKKVREEEGGAVGALQVPELFTASETSPLI